MSLLETIELVGMIKEAIGPVVVRSAQVNPGEGFYLPGRVTDKFIRLADIFMHKGSFKYMDSPIFTDPAFLEHIRANSEQAHQHGLIGLSSTPERYPLRHELAHYLRERKFDTSSKPRSNSFMRNTIEEIAANRAALRATGWTGARRAYNLSRGSILSKHPWFRLLSWIKL